MSFSAASNQTPYKGLFFAWVIKMFKKEFCSKFIFTIIISLLFTGIVYAFPSMQGTLRLPLGQEDDTLIRIKAACIKKALEPYSRERAYLLDPKNTTLLLAVLDVKPAYWSWSPKKTPREFRIIQNISEILGLRFISYDPFGNNMAETACFVYNPKTLAAVFLKYKEQLMNPDFYLGRITEPQISIEAFKSIDLEGIVASERFEEMGEQLEKLDNYIVTITRVRSTNDVSSEPYPLGLAMGYDGLDVEEYLKARKDMVSPSQRLNVVVSSTHDVMMALRDRDATEKLLTEWIGARDMAQRIIDGDRPAPKIKYFIRTRGSRSSL